MHHITGHTLDEDWFFPSYFSKVPASTVVPPLAAPFISGSLYTVLPQDLTTEFPALVYYLGADIQLPNNFRLITEFARRKPTAAFNGIDTKSGYIALSKEIGKWTPYIYFSAIRTRSDVLDLYEAIENAPKVTALLPIPAVREAADLINSSQRAAADSLTVIDQSTIAVGSSYRIMTNHLLKFEWARSHVGVASSLVDAPPGGRVSDKDIDVFSFSYNFVF